jgi:hypothetical protein
MLGGFFISTNSAQIILGIILKDNNSEKIYQTIKYNNMKISEIVK